MFSKMKTKKGRLSFFPILLTFSLIAVIVVTGYLMIEVSLEAEDYCNNKYGVGNWEWNETTGTGDYRHYIGQAWECVPLSENKSEVEG